MSKRNGDENPEDRTDEVLEESRALRKTIGDWLRQKRGMPPDQPASTERPTGRKKEQ